MGEAEAYVEVKIYARLSSDLAIFRAGVFFLAMDLRVRTCAALRAFCYRFFAICQMVSDYRNKSVCALKS